MKVNHLLLGIFMVFLILVCLCSAGVTFAANKPVIAVVNKVLVGDPFLVTISDEVKKTAENLGMDVIVQAASSHGRADEQIAIIEDLISRKVDGIILLPADSSVVIPGRIISPRRSSTWWTMRPASRIRSIWTDVFSLIATVRSQPGLFVSRNWTPARPQR